MEWNSGMENGKWNGMEYVQLSLTPVTVTVIQGVCSSVVHLTLIVHVDVVPNDHIQTHTFMYTKPTNEYF